MRSPSPLKRILRHPMAALCLLLAAVSTVSTVDLPAQATVRLNPAPDAHSRVVTRWNLRRYENGRYLGLTFREIDATLRSADGYGRATGQALVFEQTLRDMRDVARAVQSSAPGRLPEAVDLFQPLRASTLPLRSGFPAFPSEAVAPGDRWQAPGIEWVDPDWSGKGLLVPFNASYRYEGSEIYQNRRVHRISAEYGLRWPPQTDEEIDLPVSDIVSLRSAHQVVILLDEQTLRPVLLRDTIREEFRMADGRTITFDGFSLTWHRTITPGADRAVVQTIEQGLAATPVPGVVVELTERGARIRLDDLRFVADSARLLPQEGERLSQVAAGLLRLPADVRFLVVGHTARAGTESGQLQLSIERASAVVTALTGRGIEARRFLYEGKGATDPVADNTTEEGRAANRRVEIFILSD